MSRWWKYNEKSTWCDISRIISNHCDYGCYIDSDFNNGHYSLETEKEISAKNDVQREARLIMEYMTEKMRNKNMVWIQSGRWKLCESSDGFTCISTNIYLIYEPNTNPSLGLGTMKMGSGNVLSSHVKFTPPATPNEDDDNQQLVTVELTIDKTEETGESFVLKSEIYYDRFNKVISESGRYRRRKYRSSSRRERGRRYTGGE